MCVQASNQSELFKNPIEPERKSQSLLYFKPFLWGDRKYAISFNKAIFGPKNHCTILSHIDGDQIVPFALRNPPLALMALFVWKNGTGALKRNFSIFIINFHTSKKLVSHSNSWWSKTCRLNSWMLSCLISPPSL